MGAFRVKIKGWRFYLAFSRGAVIFLRMFTKAQFFCLTVFGVILMIGPVGQGTASTRSADRTAAVILAYQQVDEPIYPAGNISSEQFSRHIAELTGGDYNILPLDRIVAALRGGDPLPDRTVAITFNGGYKSALQNAIPLLLARDLPFTVFFAPEQAALNSPQYMSWDELRRLARNPLVTLGLHSASYTRLAGEDDAEIRRQVNNALTLTRKELRRTPSFFAYPFGEYSLAYRNIIAESGFQAAFGQQSGAAHPGADPFALPRFALTENYADTERFRMVASALPLPVGDIVPDDPYIRNENPPLFGFTLGDGINPAALGCFVTEHGQIELQTLGNNRFELRAPAPFGDERVRMNCTVPVSSGSGAEEEMRWRWFGLLLALEPVAEDETSH